MIPSLFLRKAAILLAAFLPKAPHHASSLGAVCPLGSAIPPPFSLPIHYQTASSCSAAHAQNLNVVQSLAPVPPLALQCPPAPSPSHAPQLSRHVRLMPRSTPPFPPIPAPFHLQPLCTADIFKQRAVTKVQRIHGLLFARLRLELPAGGKTLRGSPACRHAGRVWL